MITTARYARVSREESGKKDLSIPTQLQEIDKHRHLAEEILVDTYVAEGISGDTDDNQAIQQLLSDAKDGKFKRLYIYAISRFSRNPRLTENWLFELRELCRIEIIFLDIPMNQNHYAYEQYERERGNRARDISIEGKEGSLRGQRQLASEGFKAGGSAKYGYMLKKEVRRKLGNGEIIKNSRIVPNPKTFPIAKEILERLANHESHGGIARELNHRSVYGPSAWDAFGMLIKKCTYCKRKYYADENPDLKNCPECDSILKQPKDSIWYKSSISNIEKEAEWTYSGKSRYNYHNARIKSGEYKGQYKGGRYIDGKYVGTKLKPQSDWVIIPCEPCIDEETLNKIKSHRSITPTLRKNHGRRNTNRQLFNITCTCGGTFTKRGQGNIGCNKRLSIHNGCENPIIKQERVEKAMIRFIQEKLLTAKIIDEIRYQVEQKLKQSPYDRIGDLKKVRSELKKIEQKLKEYKHLFDENKIDADAFVEYTNDLRLKRTKIKQQVETLSEEYQDDSPIIREDAIQQWQCEMTKSLDEKNRENLADLLNPVVRNIVLHPPISPRNEREISFNFYPFFDECEATLKENVPKGI